MTKDPVCFSDVDEKRASQRLLTSEQENRLYYFCCEECKAQFDREPGAFITTEPDWGTDAPGNYVR